MVELVQRRQSLTFPRALYSRLLMLPRANSRALRGPQSSVPPGPHGPAASKLSEVWDAVPESRARQELRGECRERGRAGGC